MFLLPEIIFGLKPLGDGWKTFFIGPRPGLLEWAMVMVTTKYGNIEKSLDGKNLVLIVPAGVTAIMGERKIIGPVVFRKNVKWPFD